MKLFTLVAALLVSSVSFAAAPQKLSLPLGHSTTMTLPKTVSKVSVSDPSKVEIKKQGRKVTLVGLEKGTTEATIRTKDGETRLNIYVAADKYAMPY
jgi:Flp pilus assembly secretin CpaC